MRARSEEQSSAGVPNAAPSRYTQNGGQSLTEHDERDSDCQVVKRTGTLSRAAHVDKSWVAVAC